MCLSVCMVICLDRRFLTTGNKPAASRAAPPSKWTHADRQGHQDSSGGATHQSDRFARSDEPTPMVDGRSKWAKGSASEGKWGNKGEIYAGSPPEDDDAEKTKWRSNRGQQQPLRRGDADNRYACV
jgi:hypothetical protein